jgi:hypothetical protein
MTLTEPRTPRRRTKGTIIANKKRLVALLCVMAGGLMAQEAKVTSLVSKDQTSR